MISTREDGFPETLAVLGSTGSVGRQALSVAREHGIAVDLLAAGQSVSALEEQIREFHPRLCAVSNEAAARDLAVRVGDTDTRILSGEAGLSEAIAESKAPVTVNSIVGKDGLRSTMDVLKKGGRLALSNKESLVVAGHLVKEAQKESGAELLPVDSEHCAIFQCLKAGKKEEVKRLILTASGGPFYGRSLEELRHITKKETLSHPTWKMGEKITVDSATLMNKGLELIEAAHLFDMAPSDIAVVIQRESIIHSAVEYIDNAVIAQMSVPDMRACVQYALSYPKREKAVIEPLDLSRLGSLHFGTPDEESFRLLPLARWACEVGGSAPAILNAANEVAVAWFLAERIGFLTIADVVEETLSCCKEYFASGSMEAILAADREARRVANEILNNPKGKVW